MTRPELEVESACTRDVVTLRDDQTAADMHDIVATHQGFPVVDHNGDLLGVVTRRDFVDVAPTTPVRDLIRRSPAVVFLDSSLRDAADQMVREDVGRLPVVERANLRRLAGFITRSDLLSAHARRLEEERR